MSSFRSAWKIQLASVLFALGLDWIGTGCAHTSEDETRTRDRSRWPVLPVLPPCSLESDLSSDEPGRSPCVTILFRKEHVALSGRSISTMFLRRPTLGEEAVPMYYLLDTGGRSGSLAQLQARGYDALCAAARSNGSAKRPPRPPRRHDDNLISDVPYETGMIEVTTEGAATAFLPYGSELYGRVYRAWNEVSAALAWVECAPPDR